MLTSRKTYDIIAKHYANGGIAQWLEHPVHTRQVIGSNPISATRPVGQAVKTRPFHGCNMGSIPVRVTSKTKRTLTGVSFCFADGPYRTESNPFSHLCESGSQFMPCPSASEACKARHLPVQIFGSLA